MAPIKNPNSARRQTGTVPKTTSSSSSSSLTTSTPVSKSSSTVKVPSSSSSVKNTEIVAPTRRELNDLNDYLLSVAESTKQSNNGGQHLHLDPTCFELDNLNFQENQRFYWPVRPLPRRNIINKEVSSDNNQHLISTTNPTTGCIHPTNYILNNNNNNTTTGSAGNNPSSGQSSQAIGVVIPTTPSSIAIDHNYAVNRSQHLNTSLQNNQQQSISENTTINQAISNLDSDLTWEQRLNFIQYFLSLTSKSLNKDNKSVSDIQIDNLKITNMVNETKEGFYNSTSLEDVAHTEVSDTRAQSVTSIHSTSIPNTPTYEELQLKLEASNRNIQNIKDQQQQLLRLQQAAKDHLSEMENIRNQQNRPAHFNQNGSAPPVYESVQQVHSDMSNLVNRMKNLTTFIQGQHELSTLLGEDGPEILAEQEALQSKLQELQAQKQDMRNLVNELQEINITAENSLKSRSQDGTRTVPIEYQRVVPIELVGASKQQTQASISNGHYEPQNGHCNGNSEHESSDNNSADVSREEESQEVIAETAGLIQQKMADINTMKNQLKRLKDMMDTVKLIEHKSEGKSIQEIANEAEYAIRNRTPPQIDSTLKTQVQTPPRTFATDDNSVESTLAKEAEMSEKVRVLHEMTQDLREQALSLASERDRLKILKEEMVRRRDSESIENISKHETNQVVKDEKQILKAEYEVKKQEFEKLCERLQSEEELVHNEAATENNEHVTDREDIKRENGLAYLPENWRRQNILSSNSSVRGGKQSTMPPTPIRGKDSADSGAADIHGIASLEAGSLQSGSSRSFSMPPPMRALNTRDTPWRKNSQDNSQSQFELYAPLPPPLPAWNSGYYYAAPYAQPYNPHCHHHMMAAGTSDYFCSHNFHGNAVAQAPAPASNSQQQAPTQSVVTSNDPVLLQQFIQTQQMLINSVCQCNQLLWHQQREINNLNNAVVLLQERILNSTNPDQTKINANTNRAESVPPAGVTVANNLYTSAHRAQSEQPFQSVQQPLSSPVRHQYHGYNYANSYHQHQLRRNINNMHHQGQQSATYSLSSTEQGSVLCSQLPPPVPHSHPMVYNNVPQSPQSSNFLNNDVPYSANLHQQHPAPPIFMHHHNNTITPSDVNAVDTNLQQSQSHHTNNNSNLLTTQQNCLNSATANASQSAVTNNSVPVQNNSSNAAAAASALNNQVPPGNRANNYWDNFRSYSRQNLLSSNSCKSNEEQQQQQQQISALPFGVNAIANANLNGVRNLHQLNASSSGNSSSNSNNLTPPTFDNKYVHTFRNQFNTNIVAEQLPENPLNHQVSTQSVVVHSQPVPGSVENHGITAVQPSPHNSALLINQSTQSENINLNNEMFTMFNNNSNNSSSNNNVTAIFGSSDFRNMNFNFGANDFRKKIPFKTSCNTKRIRHSQSLTNEMIQPNRGLMSAQMASTACGGNDFDDEDDEDADNDEDAAGASGVNRNICLDEVDQQQFMNEDNENDDENGETNACGYCETSEEIKKNLLVNALRNDKFTSKFFETLKEDVYREVYCILQATESQPQYVVQLFKELQLVPTTDPIRNIVMQAMHDIYKRSCIDRTDSNDQCPNNLSDSNNATVPENENVAESMNQAESNQENELMNILFNSTELRRLAYKIMFDCDRSPSPVEKDNKVGVKYNLSSSPSSSPKPITEIYRPDYDLVNHIMTIIRNSIQVQKIEDEVMIRIAKLTISSLERLSSTLGNNTLQIDRLLISPKELFRKMKTFERRDRDAFLERYESYLQTMFVMKIVNDDANNVNLATKKPASPSSSMLANSLSLTSADMQNLRRHALATKSNIISSGAFGLELNCNKKADHQSDTAGQNEMANGPTTSSKIKTATDENKQSQQKNRSRARRTKSNVIATANANLLFGNNDANASNDTLSSPTTNGNNIMNEDLAEADQVCSSSTAVTSEISTTKFLANEQQKHVENSTTNEHNEIKGNDKEIDRRSNSNQEPEAENFGSYSMFRKISSENCNVDSTENCNGSAITSASDVHIGNEPHPIMNDAACAVLYQPNGNVSTCSINSSAGFVPNSTTNGNLTDNKQKNGVP